VGIYGNAAGNFNAPTGAGVDSSGYIYVADNGNNRIQKFSSEGAFITQWGTSGSGNSQFSSPYAVAIGTGNEVFVVDTGNNRIEKFSSAGTFQVAWVFTEPVRAAAFSTPRWA